MASKLAARRFAECRRSLCGTPIARQSGPGKAERIFKSEIAGGIHIRAPNIRALFPCEAIGKVRHRGKARDLRRSSIFRKDRRFRI